MAKLVQKSGYIKSEKAGGYMKYIATREGVEKLTGNGPVTKGQRELIQKLLHDFPDAVELFEYEDYRKAPTLGTASAFITMALDANLHEINSESGYMSYIATRPRVERRGAHGLFSSAAAVDLDAAMSELEAHDGNVWTIIYSLRREDAARLGYDNADAWRGLLMMHAQDLAKAMKIPADHFRWYAAFHNEGHQPRALSQNAGRACPEDESGAKFHQNGHNSHREILSVCTIQCDDLRRMWESIQARDLDIPREKAGCLAVHQSLGLRKAIL